MQRSPKNDTPAQGNAPPRQAVKLFQCAVDAAGGGLWSAMSILVHPCARVSSGPEALSRSGWKSVSDAVAA